MSNKQTDIGYSKVTERGTPRLLAIIQIQITLSSLTYYCYQQVPYSTSLPHWRNTCCYKRNTRRCESKVAMHFLLKIQVVITIKISEHHYVIKGGNWPKILHLYISLLTLPGDAEALSLLVNKLILSNTTIY
jgi:hypothetical protein